MSTINQSAPKFSPGQVVFLTAGANSRIREQKSDPFESSVKDIPFFISSVRTQKIPLLHYYQVQYNVDVLEGGCFDHQAMRKLTHFIEADLQE